MTTAAELVIQEAVRRGNRYVFGIPGGGPGMWMAAAAAGHGCRFVLVNNEATAAMAAAAYGQLVGAPGICFAIQGTGGGNLLGGVVTCYLERDPVIAITDRYPDSLLGGVKMQDAHLGQVFAPVVKGSMTLSPASARATLRAAFDLAWAERPGPVHVEFPTDCATAQVADSDASTDAAPSADPAIAGDVERAARVLQDARRVVVIVGTDAARAGAGDEVRTLVETWRAVALACWRARGLLPETHPRYGGTFYGNFAPDTGEMDFLSSADVVVLAGVDPVEVSQPWPADLPKVLQLHQSPDVDEACPSASVKLCGPLKTLLGRLALARAAKSPCPPGASRSGFTEREIEDTRDSILRRFAPATGEVLSAQSILESARRLLPSDGILVQETGIYNVLSEHVWPVLAPGTCLSTGGSRTMGAAIPWAIGAALARPQANIMALCGDGGFLMRLQELEVVARLGLRIVFVVFDDGQLGTIHARAVGHGLHMPGLQFAPLDYFALAAGFGLRAEVIDQPARFEVALEQALAADRSTVIDVKLDPVAYTSLFPRLIGARNSILEISAERTTNP